MRHPQKGFDYILRSTMLNKENIKKDLEEQLFKNICCKCLGTGFLLWGQVIKSRRNIKKQTNNLRETKYICDKCDGKGVIK